MPKRIKDTTQTTKTQVSWYQILWCYPTISYVTLIDDVDEWGAIIKNQTESYNRLNNLQRMAKRELMNDYGKELSKEAQNRHNNEQMVPLKLLTHRS